jgi:heme-degrading monooxygenase HmoA
MEKSLRSADDQTTRLPIGKTLECVDAPGEFISYSEWDNQANIDKYRESQAHAEIQKHSRALQGGKASVKRYEVK